VQPKKVFKENLPRFATPSGVPSIRHKRTGLRNSHDPLRGHVLKQCSPSPTARSRLIEAAHRGGKSKTAKQVGLAHYVGRSPTLTIASKFVRAAHTRPLFFISPVRRRVAQTGQGISARTV
jgi:hypothetical protein